MYEMLLLVGTSMLIQRFLMGFFWSGIFEMGRNVRSGAFDFVLAQPGDPLFMASTRKLELDGLLNSVVAAGLVVYSARKLGLHPGRGRPGALRLHGRLRGRHPLQRARPGHVALVLDHELAGRRGQLFHPHGILPAAAGGLRGASPAVIFVWALPVVVVSNAPGPRPPPRIRAAVGARASARPPSSGSPRRRRLQARPAALHQRQLMSGDLQTPSRRGSATSFRDPALLERALTHPSWLQDHPGAPGNNQRLEFLGDSVLQLVLTEALFALFPGGPRGRAHQAPRDPRQGRVPCPASPARSASTPACAWARTRRRPAAAERDAALEDAFEALVGAVNLDGGLESAAQGRARRSTATLGAPRRARGPSPTRRAASRRSSSPCTATRRSATRCSRPEGADHEREYEVAVFLLDRRLGSGRGPSKKPAEEEAARAALAALEADARRPDDRGREAQDRRRLPGGAAEPSSPRRCARIRRPSGSSSPPTSGPPSSSPRTSASSRAAQAAGPRPETLVFPESIPDSRDMREAFAASGDRLTVLSRLRAPARTRGGRGRRPPWPSFATPSVAPPARARDRAVRRERARPRPRQHAALPGAPRAAARPRLRQRGGLRGAGPLRRPRRDHRRLSRDGAPSPTASTSSATRSRTSGPSTR